MRRCKMSKKKSSIFIRDFSEDPVFKASTSMGITPETFIKNYVPKHLEHKSPLIMYAKQIGIKPETLARKLRKEYQVAYKGPIGL